MTCCKDCLFAEVVEDEDFMACQAKQRLVMPDSGICDMFEQFGCVCSECTTKVPEMTGKLNLNKLFENSTEDEYCNANSYPVEEREHEMDVAREFLLEDLKDSYLAVLETMAALGEGGTNKDVLRELLGLEATIPLIKRFLLELEE